MDFSHIPVLQRESIEALAIVAGEKYIDCTYGGGGHSRLIVQQGGLVLGLDVDEDVVATVHEGGVKVVRGNFENVADIAHQQGFVPCSGVLFDLGVSSYQLDTDAKGFSFMRSGPLDMRMDQRLGITAGKLLDVLDEKSMGDLFLKYGEENHSRLIAKKIVEERQRHAKGYEVTVRYWEDKTTTDLAQLIESLVGRKERIHPATRIFQAIRMAVNDETGALHRGLEGAFEILKPQGRIVVISFHSIEDRIVKDFMDKKESDGMGKIVVVDGGEVVMASEREVTQNSRSRSAKMRVLEKIQIATGI